VEKWKPADTGNEKKQLRDESPKKMFGKKRCLHIDA